MIGAQWRLFDSVSSTDGALWKYLNYNANGFKGGVLPMYTLDSSYYGDWVYIQFPEAIVVTSCTFTARDTQTRRAPSKFRIYGSNNGNDWTVIHDQTSAISYLNNSARVSILGASPYSYVGLVVSALNAPSSDETLNFMKWQIYGLVFTYIHTYRACLHETLLFCWLGHMYQPNTQALNILFCSVELEATRLGALHPVFL